MKKTLLLFLPIIIVFICPLSRAQIFDIPHVGGAPTRTSLLLAKEAKAAVLLFPGGGGMLHLSEDGSTKNGHTFVRSKNLWAQYEINAILVDTPYDLGDLRRGDLRYQDDHLQRVGEVIDFYSKKLSIPIWIFGHSMGSSTVSNYLNQVNKNRIMPAGGIIAGTIRTVSINSNVTAPLMAIHHRQDSCPSTPPNISIEIIRSRSKDPRSKLVLIEGGISEGDVCQAFAYHGFNQTESTLVDAAASFIFEK
jgi:hypothetical protein